MSAYRHISARELIEGERAADIAKALGGCQIGAGRFMCHCPVPTHGRGRGDKNPSLSIADGDRELLVFCHGGCDPRDVLATVRGQFLNGTVNVLGREAAPSPRPVPSSNTNHHVAIRLWDESKPLPDTLGAIYFREHRRVDLDSLDDLSHCLRWHPGKQMIVALMTDPVTNEPTGVHRTFLNANGGKRERKMLGRQGVIRLSPDDAVSNGLGICEGVEDGLALLLGGWCPIWVATSAGAIRKFPVLSGVEALTIFADADTAGIEAATACAERWNNSGADAVAVQPRGGNHA